jgi:ribonucleotide monophosphatase NagD (HAD superfamily)
LIIVDIIGEKTLNLGDIRARPVGLKTALMTTGVDSEESSRQKNIQPDAVLAGLDELIKVWQSG